jgi:hypothetical protein
MRVLSLWQPWASAVAAGAKVIETRSWQTSYRGPLLIHAAKRFDADDMEEMAECPVWIGALWPLRFGDHPGLTDAERAVSPARRARACLPLGSAVAVCELADCRPAGSFRADELDRPRHRVAFGPDVDRYSWTERMMGDFGPGRFGWVLAGVRPLPAPVPCVGHQGLFNAPPAVLAAVLAQLLGGAAG